MNNLFYVEQGDFLFDWRVYAEKPYGAAFIVRMWTKKGAEKVAKALNDFENSRVDIEKKARLYDECLRRTQVSPTTCMTICTMVYNPFATGMVVAGLTMPGVTVTPVKYESLGSKPVEDITPAILTALNVY